MTLYHASQRQNLKIIKPQKTVGHDDKYIGNFVFATKNKKLATMYLVPKGIATLMSPESNGPNIVICANEKDYIKQDKGGAIYNLPGKNFVETPQKGLGRYEMVSTHEIKPLNRTVYHSSVDALLSAGIKIRFTNKNTFNDLLNNPNQEKMIKNISLYKP